MSDGLVVAGLIVNMTGVAVAFFFGFPQSLGPGAMFIIETEQVAGHDRWKVVRRRLSYAGLVLIFIGFGLQLAGVLAA